MSEQRLWSIGAEPVRLEDSRLLRGQGAYLDDQDSVVARDWGEPLHLVVVRSPHARARIRSINVESVSRSPGVRGVYSAVDTAAAGLRPLRPSVEVNPHTQEPFRVEYQGLLAAGEVRYVGEPVALVVAQTQAQAEQAADLIDIDYEPLVPVVDARAALVSDAPQVSEQVPGNCALDWRFGDAQRADAIFDNAEQVVELELVNHRIVQSPMENRGAIGRYDPAGDDYELFVSTQNVHVIAGQVANCLGAAPDQVRLRAPDVGGGFGVRNFSYPEYALVLWLARLLAQPVKWRNSRSESFLSDHQARDLHVCGRLALDAAGQFLALKVDACFNAGAYVSGAGCGVPCGQYVALPTSVYDIPTVDLDIKVALTHTTPIGVTRGPGFAETVEVIERLIDRAASEFGHDRFELRRRNLVSPGRMPWKNSVGTTVDSGDFAACFEAALNKADLSGFEQRRHESKERGKLRGLGVAMHIKATGGSPEENVQIDFLSDKVIFTTGTQAIGQGHETTMRQIVGDRLGLDHDQIEYRAGDTGLIPIGGGHGSSRATYMAGTAIALAADKIIEQGRAVAARLWQVDPERVQFEAGQFRADASDQVLSVLDIAAIARRDNQPLDTYVHHTREAMTYPSGCHVAELEVDPDTGAVCLQRYTAVDDCGVLVNPMVASGQVHGAIAQGVGQALLEHAVYEKSSGQALTGSFMDYALPRADDLPSFDLSFAPTSCTTNPLGVKGCGESGAVAGFPAINNAVLDALSPLGIRDFDGPANSFHIWRALQSGGRPS